MTDHANELRRHARKIPHPQGETPGVMLRAADEIERLQSVIASPHNMTRDDIINFAISAGFHFFDAGHAPMLHTTKANYSEEYFKRFAELIAAAERDACAVICDTMSSSDFLPRQCSAAIRARGGPCQDQ